MPSEIFRRVVWWYPEDGGCKLSRNMCTSLPTHSVSVFLIVTTVKVLNFTDFTPVYYMGLSLQAKPLC